MGQAQAWRVGRGCSTAAAPVLQRPCGHCGATGAGGGLVVRVCDEVAEAAHCECGAAHRGEQRRLASRSTPAGADRHALVRKKDDFICESARKHHGCKGTDTHADIQTRTPTQTQTPTHRHTNTHTTHSARDGGSGSKRPEAANERESDVTQSMHARASECIASECGYVYNKPCGSHHEYDTTCMYELMFPGFDTRPCPELRHVSNMTWGSAMHACLRFPGRRCAVGGAIMLVQRTIVRTYRSTAESGAWPRGCCTSN